MGADVLERPDTVTTTGDGDHDKFSHYVTKNDLAAATFDGKVIHALCGKQWRPDSDPDRYPLCPRCKEVFDALR